MIYIKCFEIADKCVMLVPRKNNFAVRAIGYRSPRYKGLHSQNFVNYKYDIESGSLSECNDIFNLEVSYLTKIYDEDIYTLAELMRRKEEVIF